MNQVPPAVTSSPARNPAVHSPLDGVRSVVVSSHPSSTYPKYPPRMSRLA